MTDTPTLRPLPGFSGPDAPDDEGLHRCVHCGFCLQACPTYLETGLETASPRGRIALMRAVAEGRTALTDRVLEHWDLCLLCRACEAACPSGVPYGALMEAARTQAERVRPRSLVARALSRLAFRELLPHPARLRFLGAALRAYQRTVQRPLRATGLLARLPGRLAQAEAMLPPLPARFFTPAPYPTRSGRAAGRRVALLAGCVQSVIFGPVNEATVRVLARNSCEVVAPPAQVCCGALHAHSGHLPTARDLARRNIDTFLATGVDAVIVNAAGCGAMLKEYGHLLADDPAYAEQAARFSALVRDFSEFLAENLTDRDFGPLPWRVTYQDPCHLAHAQRIHLQPRALLRLIPGLELVETPAADRCCGSAGIYNLTQSEMSLRLLESKMADVATSRAAVVVTANPGCQVQLTLGLQRAGLPGRVMHLAEVLDAAYRAAPRPIVPEEALPRPERQG
ncbi:MAG: 4Fe-4S dicluster domain-containing protein [Chloroflexi bacterium]|nr:4Fe-4S dicluster domain-containing protein [Chloroflexota bacterium]